MQNVPFIAVVMFAVPGVLSSLGMSSRRILVVCVVTCVCVIGLASVFGELDLRHVDVPGWMLGCFYSALMMLSFGLFAVLRRLFGPVKKNHDEVA